VQEKVRTGGIEDAYADPPTGDEKGPAGNFVFLYGIVELSAYLVEHRALPVLSLLLAIHRRQNMSGLAKVALTPAVWKDAGDPPRHTRETLLAHLRRMPGLVLLTEERNLLFRYRVAKGPAWLRMEKVGKRGKK
jgi:hypothetical protein